MTSKTQVILHMYMPSVAYFNVIYYLINVYFVVKFIHMLKRWFDTMSKTRVISHMYMHSVAYYNVMYYLINVYFMVQFIHMLKRIAKYN
ncbi:hypothetical protein LguiA_012423 [Lonicera macranthoides]